MQSRSKHNWHSAAKLSAFREHFRHVWNCGHLPLPEPMSDKWPTTETHVMHQFVLSCSVRQWLVELCLCVWGDTYFLSHKCFFFCKAKSQNIILLSIKHTYNIAGRHFCYICYHEMCTSIISWMNLPHLPPNMCDGETWRETVETIMQLLWWWISNKEIMLLH